MAGGLLPESQNVAKTSTSSIEESKQVARSVVAASGAGSAPIQSGSSANTTPSDDYSIRPNGRDGSRKRSRSGSRIQNSSQQKSLVPRTKEIFQKQLLEQYLNREQMHTAATIYGDHQRLHTTQRMQDERRLYEAYKDACKFHEIDIGNVFGHGYRHYRRMHRDVPAQKPLVILPHSRPRPGGRKSKELKISRKDRAIQAEQLDELVPIRLDIEWDKIRLRDTFVWNIHDRVVGTDVFAQQLVEDLSLPLAQYEQLVHQVQSSVQEQLNDFHPHIFTDEEALDPHLPYTAYKNDEMRIIIKLNITIGSRTLVDQFEWEINNPLNQPEEFARQMARDLSLNGEFTTAIAHSIREQSQLFTRSLYVVGHPFDGRPIEDHELLASFQPSPLPSAFRPYQAAKDFTPALYELNEAELEKTELSLSRDERRQKRSVNRRGGPALPDLKDRRRTIRTLLVSSVLPGAVESIEDSRIFKRTVAASKKGRITRGDGIDDSEESDSDISLPDSPAIPAHLLAGTARTRGMRGAASAAQAAMRANMGRSATPEFVGLHHHETRTSGRRIIRDDSSPEPPASLIIKLRLPRLRLQQLLRAQRAKSKEGANASGNHPSSRNSSVPATSVPGSMGPPSSTPRSQQQNSPNQSNGVPASTTPKPQTSKHGATSQLGRVEASGPPGPDHPTVR